MYSCDLVSIVIPCYNGSLYLDQSIESALSQSHPNIEVIVVDDGSTDNSIEIAQSYAEHIRLIKQPNSGVSAARNTGIIHAKGEYIMLLDADDILHPLAVERRIKIIKNDQKMGLVLGHFSFVDENDRKLEVSTRQREIPIEDAFYYLIRKSFGPLASLFRTEVYRKCGLFDPFLAGSEDRDFFIRCASKYRVGYDPEIGGYYRENLGSLTRNVNKMIRESKRMYRKNETLRKDSFRYSIHKFVGLLYVYNFYFRRVFLEPGIEKKTSLLKRSFTWLPVCFYHPELFFLSPLLACRIFLESAKIAKPAYPFSNSS